MWKIIKRRFIAEKWGIFTIEETVEASNQVDVVQGVVILRQRLSKIEWVRNQIVWAKKQMAEDIATYNHDVELLRKANDNMAMGIEWLPEKIDAEEFLKDKEIVTPVWVAFTIDENYTEDYDNSALLVPDEEEKKVEETAEENTSEVVS